MRRILGAVAGLLLLATSALAQVTPGVPLATNTVFGKMHGDGTTITCVAGICATIGAAPTGAAGGVLSGTYPNPGFAATATNTILGNATSGSAAPTALAIGSCSTAASALIWTTNTGFGCNTSITAATTLLATGTSVSLTAPREYYVCTGTCTVTPPVPVAGYEFCVWNKTNVATVITLAALGSSATYENTARTAAGTAGTGTFVSGGAVGDKVCIVGVDSTHYETPSFNGTWTAN